MINIRRRIITAFLMLLFLFGLFGSLDVNAEVYFELGKRILKTGCEGPDVAIMQRRLQELSYYKGEIDGLYGPRTKRAVQEFQRDKGLRIDGVAGPMTFKILGPENESRLLSRMDFSRDDIVILARIIHGEARGESFKGKVGVGAVVLNRINSNRFPDTMREVVLQEGQFSSLLDGQANYFPLQSSLDAARAALLGYDPTHNSLYFYNPQVATNVQWISGRPVTVQIGEHVFAR